MMIDGLVSIIMPAFNAEPFIGEAIRSVIRQDYENWQLIIINDGSTDRTDEIIRTFQDPRILYFRKPNKGVSAARNTGLDKCAGEFICFLDADDVLTPKSLGERVKALKERPDVDFVDGSVIVTKRDLQDVIRNWTPSFEGQPVHELTTLRDTCFITISWMIRASAIGQTRFREGLSHCEDLLFLIDISVNRNYTFVCEPILFFRRTGSSAMTNIVGLGEGYLALQDALRQKTYVSFFDRILLKWKINKIMFLSFVAEGSPLKAISFVLKNIVR